MVHSTAWGFEDSEERDFENMQSQVVHVLADGGWKYVPPPHTHCPFTEHAHTHTHFSYQLMVDFGVPSSGSLSTCPLVLILIKIRSSVFVGV